MLMMGLNSQAGAAPRVSSPRNEPAISAGLSRIDFTWKRWISVGLRLSIKREE